MTASWKMTLTMTLFNGQSVSGIMVLGQWRNRVFIIIYFLGGTGGQRGVDLRLGGGGVWGQEEASQLKNVPSHLLRTIKSQMGPMV